VAIKTRPNDSVLKLFKILVEVKAQGEEED
jgi:hypothetical protein